MGHQESNTELNSTKLSWNNKGSEQTARWQSEAGNTAPKRLQLINDTLSADAAYKLACEGTAMLWQGDFQNAKHLMQAISRRIDNRFTKPKAVKYDPAKATQTPKDKFHLYRKNQIERARTLGMLLVEMTHDYVLPYNRAPEVKLACECAYGKSSTKGKIVLSLRELLGVIGAYEWRKNGVEIAELSQHSIKKIMPYYGVYSPIRGEYLSLIDSTPLPKKCEVAFDIGTGTGVIAAILAQRGVKEIIATDNNPRALQCAAYNVEQLGIKTTVEIIAADLFPVDKRADLIVCNPPWLPASANSLIDRAIYDPNSAMLKGFLIGLNSHLKDDGEGWLILSDLAEHLGLRTSGELQNWIKEAGLRVVEKRDVTPKHAKSTDQNDPLYTARSKEITSLYRLKSI